MLGSRGVVAYSLRDNANSCRHVKILAEGLNNADRDAPYGDSVVPATGPIVVEYRYVQSTPAVTCRVAVEFTPEGGATYFLYLQELPIQFGGRCDPVVKRLLPHGKKFGDVQFKKVCASGNSEL
jgi:hypothetical protein